MILGWGELQEEDVPPEEIWLDDEALNAHFDDVRERWKSKGSGGQTEAVADVDEQNELTRGLRRG